MARVLRTRQPVNNEIGPASPTKIGIETPSIRSTRSRRFHTPENVGSSSSSSRRNSQASSHSTNIDIARALPHDVDAEDDDETIYVRPMVSGQSSSQETPRKRRKITRVPGSPSAQLMQIVKPAAKALKRFAYAADDHQDYSNDEDHPPEEVPLAANEGTTSGNFQQSIPGTSGDADMPTLKSEDTQSNTDLTALDEKFDVHSSLICPEFQENTSIEKAQSTASEVFLQPSAASTVYSPELNEHAEPPTPTDPNELSDTDLPPPFLVLSSPLSESSYSDLAAYILASKYAPLSDPQIMISALLKHDPSMRSTETLYTLAENTQRVLRAWQDEYLAIDKKTAPIGNPPKKPASGGREPQDPLHFEASKEANLYSGHHAPEHLRNRRGSNGDVATTGRELRRRRDASVIDDLNISEDDTGVGTDRGKGKRSRRPPRKFDGGRLGSVTPDQSGPAGSGTGRRRAAGSGDAENNTRRRARVSNLARSDVDLSPTPEASDGGDDQMYGSRRRKVTRGGSNAANGAKRRKQRVKSEKRSESMTAWWAERKRKAAEQKIREMRESALLQMKEADELGGPVVELVNALRSGPADGTTV